MNAPVPGDNHPAVAHLAPALNEERLWAWRAPIPPVMSASVLNEPIPTEVYEPTILEFTAERAAQSLYPEYGFYVWQIWRDQYGRHVTEPKARWVENPQGFMYGEWNPVKRKSTSVTIHEPW